MHATDITFTSGPEHLAGTLLLDDQPRPAPVVLLISGSGPIDRNSNTKKLAIDVMGQIAAHLAAKGIGSFRYDKRGVGASTGDYNATGLHDNIADAAAAIEMLRSRAGVNPSRVFVVGHSEGALIATELGAADSDLAGIVLLAGTATRGEELLRWQARNVAASLPRAVKFILRALRQDVVASQSKRLARLKASTNDTERIQLVKMNAKWFREFMAHDPSPSLESLRVPVLAITGSKDIQVNPDDLHRIRGLVTSPCSVELIEDLTHLLRTDAGPPSLKTYKKQAGRPVDTQLLDRCAGWIRDRAATPSTEGAS